MKKRVCPNCGSEMVFVLGDWVCPECEYHEKHAKEEHAYR